MGAEGAIPHPRLRNARGRGCAQSAPRGGRRHERALSAPRGGRRQREGVVDTARGI
ncbi:hypothetical protein HMPREF1550_02456 [Actinomyces sp. oral taxon 877 str. F0543]|nr:hypothetical protein HMPREF1550_02456 [Actinomyces sp. oral taxon 877 str. F0543]